MDTAASSLNFIHSTISFFSSLNLSCQFSIRYLNLFHSSKSEGLSYIELKYIGSSHFFGRIGSAYSNALGEYPVPSPKRDRLVNGLSDPYPSYPYFLYMLKWILTQFLNMTVFGFRILDIEFELRC